VNVIEERQALGEAHGAVPGGAQEVVEPLPGVVAIADVQNALAVLAREPGGCLRPGGGRRRRRQCGGPRRGGRWW